MNIQLDAENNRITVTDGKRSTSAVVSGDLYVAGRQIRDFIMQTGIRKADDKLLKEFMAQLG